MESMESTNEKHWKRPVKARQRRTHEQNLAKSAAKEIKSKWGFNFSELGDTFRSAIAAEQVIRLICARCDGSKEVAGLWEFWLQLRADLNLDEIEED